MHLVDVLANICLPCRCIDAGGQQMKTVHSDSRFELDWAVWVVLAADWKTPEASSARELSFASTVDNTKQINNAFQCKHEHEHNLRQ